MRTRNVLVGSIVLLATAALAAGADRVVGTMIVDGAPTPLKNVVAELQQDPEVADASWLVVLLSDVPVPEADRAPEHLSELAREGKVKAVRVLWKEGTDTVYAVPYHPALTESGQRPVERPTINLERYDGERFEGTVKAKMLGQRWFFQASVKAALGRGGVLDLEPPAVVEEPVGGPAAAGSGPTGAKVALGRMGYSYTPEMFFHAVSDLDLEAVQLFLGLGMDPNSISESEVHTLTHAVTRCQADRERAEAVVRLLIAAGGEVNSRDSNRSTPLIWAAKLCQAGMARLLVDAGADVNARSAGGATALLMANAMGKQDMVEILRAAGATE